MEVKETNEFATNRQPQIDADDVNAYVASLFEMLREKAHNAESRVKAEWIPVIKQWIEDIKDMMAPNIKPHKLPHLSKEVLVGLCRQYKVAGSNGVAVILEERNSKYYIYFAYLNNKELLPREQNVYGVIETTFISADVKALFTESNPIILV